MKIESILLELILSPIFHFASSIVLAVVGYRVENHTHAAAYLLYTFAVVSLALSVSLWNSRRKQREREEQFREKEEAREKELQEKEVARQLADGKSYPGGELEALPDIKKDIGDLHRGATVTICGTGATAIVNIANDVYEALRRGVNFEVFVLHPHDSLVERLADMELDLRGSIVDPMVSKLSEEEVLRKLLTPEWCDRAVAIFHDREKVCDLHAQGHAKCSLHGRVICTSAEAWWQTGQQVRHLNPHPVAAPGSLVVYGYRTIPSIKAWRFSSGPSETSSMWYYVADHLYHRGVGVDNPMRRFERGPEGPAFVNRKYVDLYLERIKNLSEELFIVSATAP